MFPNVRLMIAAIAASIIALSCGFGLFAAFRVSHEPLARMPATSPPLQFAANSPGLAGWAAAAVPVSAQPTVIQTALTQRAADIAPDAEAADNREPAMSMIPAMPVAANEAATEATGSAVSQPKSEPLPDAPASSDAAPPQIATVAPADTPMPAADATPPAAVTASAQDLATAANEPGPITAAAKPDGDHGVAAARSAATATAPIQSAEAVQQSPPRAPTATATGQVQTSAATPTRSAAETASGFSAANVAAEPAARVVPKTPAKAAAKTPRKVVRRAEPKHHITARRMARRARPAPAPPSYQAFAFPQPNFQSAPQPTFAAAPQAYVTPPAPRRSRRHAAAALAD
jgi:hypothetical protein